MSEPKKERREDIAATAASWVARGDAGLTPADAAELKRWRAADPRHAAALDHYAQMWSLLDRPRKNDSTAAVLREVQVRAVRRRRRQLALGTAAALAFLVMSAFLVRLDTQPRKDNAYAEAAAGGVLLMPETRMLADGTRVQLRAGAEIAVEFTEALRRVVLLRGEAHFEVAKNPARPFAVDAGRVQVRAVGTAFSVQREATQIEVVVTEGRIAVEPPASASEQAQVAGSQQTEMLTSRPTAPTASASVIPTVTATAGERVIVSASADASVAPAVTIVSREELAERLAWREPRVEFSHTPLAEAVARMNMSARTENPLQLVIDPAAKTLAREPVSGVFRADNTEAFVRMLELSLGVQSERRGDQIVMRRAE